MDNVKAWETLGVTGTESSNSVSVNVLRNNALGLYLIRGTFTLTTTYTAGTIVPVLSIPNRTNDRVPILLYNANNNVCVNAVVLSDKVSIVHGSNINVPVVISINAIIKA